MSSPMTPTDPPADASYGSVQIAASAVVEARRLRMRCRDDLIAFGDLESMIALAQADADYGRALSALDEQRTLYLAGQGVR